MSSHTTYNNQDTNMTVNTLGNDLAHTNRENLNSKHNSGYENMQKENNTIAMISMPVGYPLQVHPQMTTIPQATVPTYQQTPILIQPGINGLTEPPPTGYYIQPATILGINHIPSYVPTQPPPSLPPNPMYPRYAGSQPSYPPQNTQSPYSQNAQPNEPIGISPAMLYNPNYFQKPPGYIPYSNNFQPVRPQDPLPRQHYAPSQSQSLSSQDSSKLTMKQINDIQEKITAIEQKELQEKMQKNLEEQIKELTEQVQTPHERKPSAEPANNPPHNPSTLRSPSPHSSIAGDQFNSINHSHSFTSSYQSDANSSQPPVRPAQQSAQTSIRLPAQTCSNQEPQQISNPNNSQMNLLLPSIPKPIQPSQPISNGRQPMPTQPPSTTQNTPGSLPSQPQLSSNTPNPLNNTSHPSPNTSNLPNPSNPPKQQTPRPSSQTSNQTRPAGQRATHSKLQESGLPQPPRLWQPIHTPTIPAQSKNYPPHLPPQPLPSNQPPVLHATNDLVATPNPPSALAGSKPISPQSNTQPAQKQLPQGAKEVPCGSFVQHAQSKSHPSLSSLTQQPPKRKTPPREPSVIPQQSISPTNTASVSSHSKSVITSLSTSSATPKQVTASEAAPQSILAHHHSQHREDATTADLSNPTSKPLSNLAPLNALISSSNSPSESNAHKVRSRVHQPLQTKEIDPMQDITLSQPAQPQSMKAKRGLVASSRYASNIPTPNFSRPQGADDTATHVLAPKGRESELLNTSFGSDNPFRSLISKELPSNHTQAIQEGELANKNINHVINLKTPHRICLLPSVNSRLKLNNRVSVEKTSPFFSVPPPKRADVPKKPKPKKANAVAKSNNQDAPNPSLNQQKPQKPTKTQQNLPKNLTKSRNGRKSPAKLLPTPDNEKVKLRERPRFKLREDSSSSEDVSEDEEYFYLQAPTIPNLMSPEERKQQELIYLEEEPETLYEPSESNRAQYKNTFDLVFGPSIPSIDTSSFDNFLIVSPSPHSVGQERTYVVLVTEWKDIYDSVQEVYGKWLSTEKLLELFYKNKFDPDSTLIAALLNRKFLIFASPRDCWTGLEKNLFEIGLREIGKNWRKIQELIKSKSVEEIMVYYYFWKATGKAEEFYVNLINSVENQKQSQRKCKKIIKNLIDAGKDPKLSKFEIKLDFDWNSFNIPKFSTSQTYAKKSYSFNDRSSSYLLSRTSKRSRPAGFYSEKIMSKKHKKK